jgi:hypothetical protein
MRAPSRASCFGGPAVPPSAVTAAGAMQSDIHVLHGWLTSTCQRYGQFWSVFHMFVPSLSWYNGHFNRTIQNGETDRPFSAYEICRGVDPDWTVGSRHLYRRAFHAAETRLDLESSVGWGCLLEPDECLHSLCIAMHASVNNAPPQVQSKHYVRTS